jgi:hypothetical protein
VSDDLDPAKAIARNVSCSLYDAAITLDGLASDGFVLVDVRPSCCADDLDNALRNYLAHTRPPSGAFGQSMEATMAYDAVRRLRAAAAKHLNRTTGAP